MFSRRLDWQAVGNRLAQLEAERRRSGHPLIDLTESNPTRVGLDYPVAALAAALAPAWTAPYRPAPFGLASARAAVAVDYARRGVELAPDALVLTASSSESYALLLKLLCDAGQTVLTPEPSYPLFELLVRLEGVVPSSYRLAFDGTWRIDFASIERALAAGGCRAIVVVSPNNPTGSCLAPDDWQRLEALAAAGDLAVIADEVFADYIGIGSAGRRNGAEGVPCVAAAARRALAFSLGGLSKSCGLPQLKLGWIAVGGPDSLVRAALDRLELVADTYLSVATPVQLALPRLFELGGEIRDRIRERLAANDQALAAVLDPSSPVSRLPAEAGWYAILRLPAVLSDEEWAIRLLQDEDVLVHPGYFFDMPRGAYLVLSLLPEPARFQEGVARLLTRVATASGLGTSDTQR